MQEFAARKYHDGPQALPRMRAWTHNCEYNEAGTPADRPVLPIDTPRWQISKKKLHDCGAPASARCLPWTQSSRSTINDLDRLSRLGDHSALLMDVGGVPWRLALEQYENRIDNTVLPSLAAEDLKAESDRCCMR